MRRLLIFSAGFSAAVLLCCYIITGTGRLIAACIFALIALLGLFLRGKKRLVLMLCTVGAVLGSLWTFGYMQLIYAPSQSYVGTEGTFTVTAVDYPMPYRECTFLTVKLSSDGIKYKAQLYIYDGIPDIEPGDILRVDGKIFSASEPLSSIEQIGHPPSSVTVDRIYLGISVSDAPEVIGRDGAQYKYLHIRLARSIADMIDAVIPDEYAHFMNALLTGDKAELYEDSALYNALKNAGVAHIVAVSGMHVSFLIGLLGAFCKKRGSKLALGIPLLLVFMGVAAFSPSVCRAVIMYSVLLTARTVKKESDGLTSLLLALMLILLINPMAVSSVSLQLSFASVLGILLFAERMSDHVIKNAWSYVWRKSRERRKITEKRRKFNLAVLKITEVIVKALAVSLGAMFFTVPLCALYFGTVSLIAPITNLLILWAVSAAFTLGLIAVITGFVFIPVGAAFGTLAALALRYVEVVCTALSQIPFAAVRMGDGHVIIWLVYVYAVVILALILKLKREHIVIPACIGVMYFCAFVLISYAQPDQSKLSVTAVDVGQGQCIVITDGESAAMVDCGSQSTYKAGDIALDYLSNKHITTLDTLFITHYHEDHVNGIADILLNVRVKCIVAPDPESTDLGYAEEIIELAQELDVELIRVREYSTMQLDKAVFHLYPPIGGDDENERCLALRCTKGSFDVMITGDMDSFGERTLIELYDIPDAELIIVGHHGSRYSTSEEYLSKTRPEAAIISVGENSYGHPTDDVLDRLYDIGAAVFRTDEGGTVTIQY